QPIIFFHEIAKVNLPPETYRAWKIENRPSDSNLSFFGAKARLFWSCANRPLAILASMSDGGESNVPMPPRHYRWPRFLVVAILLAVALAAIWLSFEIRRTERIRQLNEPQRGP